MHNVNRKAVAEGPLKTLILALLFGAVVIFVMTYAEPFSTEYEVKTAARRGCTEYANQVRWGRPTGWEEEFKKRTVQAGVQLAKEQYDFQIEQEYDRFVCRAVIAYRSQTSLFFLSDAFDMEPLKLVHRIEMKHEVKKSY